MKTREVVKALTNPIRRNDFEARRRKLGLSRVALGRILDVDPATVFRHERDNPYEALWDYALRGIEAEAADEGTKTVLRSYESKLDRQHFFPDQFEASGNAFLAEKMRDAQKQHAQKKVPRSLPNKARRAKTNGGLSDSRIQDIANRAEARAKTTGLT